MELRPGKVILTEADIVRRVEELAARINDAYAGTPVTIVGVLDGCLVFLADLIRRFEMPLELVLVRVKTYLDSERPQASPVIAAADLARLSGRRVLLVDDICDSGATICALRNALGKAGATDVKVCALLEKERPRERAASPDFVGFRIPDVFVVGYGLDYAGLYRNLPYVAQLEGYEKDREIA